MNDTNSRERYQQLRQTPEIWQALEQTSGTELQRQQKLREHFPAELVRLALELKELRGRAGEKFSRAESLWLTRQSLEQASSEAVANYKARRIAQARSGDEPVYDLCTGAGMDAIALAKSGPVTSCDTDPLILQLARWNAEEYGVAESISFLPEDVTELDFSGKLIHIDPDQRDEQGRRHRRLEKISPPLEFLQELAETCRAGALKLSPASNFGGKFPEQEAELISWRGECKQAVIWCGDLAEPGLWRATVLPEGETLAGDPLDAFPDFSDVADYVYDPDPAIVRAGLINLLAEELGIARLDEAEEYLTSSRRVTSPFLAPFRVVDVLTRNETKLRKHLRKENVGEVEIKCRHIPLDVEKLRRSLPLNGEQKRTLIYARVQGKTKIIVAKRESS